MEIRPLRADDFASYRALRLRALTEHPEAFTSSAVEEAGAGEALARRLAPDPDAPHDVMLGAFDARELVGTCGMHVEPRLTRRHRGHVYAMYVAREAAGRGVGHALVAAIVEHARRCPGLDSLVLTVTAGNEVACRLYRRHGFTEWGREPGAIRVDGVAYDKLHMIRWLADAPAADHPRHGEAE